MPWRRMSRYGRPEESQIKAAAIARAGAPEPVILHVLQGVLAVELDALLSARVAVPAAQQNVPAVAADALMDVLLARLVVLTIALGVRPSALANVQGVALDARMGAPPVDQGAPVGVALGVIIPALLHATARAQNPARRAAEIATLRAIPSVKDAMEHARADAKGAATLVQADVTQNVPTSAKDVVMGVPPSALLVEQPAVVGALDVTALAQQRARTRAGDIKIKEELIC